MDRRSFLVRGGASLAALSALGSARGESRGAAVGERTTPEDVSTWEGIQAEFDLDPDLINMSMFFLASHPRCVRGAIDQHQRGLDANPLGYYHDVGGECVRGVREAAGAYLGVSPGDIALTDSTTMGLATMYNTIALGGGQEILTTTHDHPVTIRSLKYRANRTGARVRTVALYDDASQADAGAIVDRLRAEIAPNTRILACTWVHSCTGVKMPIRAMADAIATINRSRKEQDRIILCVDGVHGLGIEDVTLPELGCDFFAGGTHKWIFGPRGTGVLWGRPEVQHLVTPTIPPFVRGGVDDTTPWGEFMTPGGFHSFEYRWALGEAFAFHQRIGKARVEARIHALNRQLKEGLAAMDHVHLHTPVSDELSAGINCFEVSGMSPRQVVDRLAEDGIVASQSPYRPSYPRLAPSLLNNESQVEACIRAVGALG